MAKSVPSSREYGYFTYTQRRHLKDNKFSKDDKSKLFKIPSGRLFMQLKGQIDDFKLMIKNEKCHSWLVDYDVKNVLDVLSGVIDEIYDFQTIPTRRLAAVRKNGKRKYCLKIIDITKSSETDLKKENYKREQMIKGLKPYEKKFVLEYMNKIGYNFPLEENRLYTWKEVKNKLSQMITKDKIVPIEKDKEVIRKRRRDAWSMIDKKFTQKEKYEMITKTGFGILVIPYSHSRN